MKVKSWIVMSAQPATTSLKTSLSATLVAMPAEVFSSAETALTLSVRGSWLCWVRGAVCVRVSVAVVVTQWSPVAWSGMEWHGVAWSGMGWGGAQ